MTRKPESDRIRHAYREKKEEVIVSSKDVSRRLRLKQPATGGGLLFFGGMMKTSDIIYREDLYPRFEANQNIIQKYSESIEYLPPIKVNQNNILIDGYHRWKAHQRAEVDEIKAEVVETESEKELKRLAYRWNSNHGLQLSNDEKRKYAVEMIAESSIDELSQILSVSKEAITKWTKSIRDELKKDRDRKIVEDYLRAENTQEMLAEKYELDHSAIQKIVNNSINTNFHNLDEPLLYNIWNTPKQDNAVSHFGAFPEIFMENLLYYHTEPLDIVFDPFAGGGTTVDVCKQMYRRYYCSDRKVIAGREGDIKEHDISEGLPEDLPKPKLVFLDPPYWKQAEGKYSDDPADLGNMDIERFNDVMSILFDCLCKRDIKLIALVIQPTQYKNDWFWTDHVFDFDKMISKKYRIKMRYILPYSTQQYLPQMITKAKDSKNCLGSHRDLIVWSNE